MRSETTGQNRAQQLVLLKGWPSIREYMRCIKRRANDGATLDDGALVADWKQAHAYAREFEPLARISVGEPLYTDLPDELTSAAEASLKDPSVRRSFGLLPHEWKLVELDRLIPWQKYVNVSFTHKLRERLPPNPSAFEQWQVSAGGTGAQPGVELSGGGNRFAFSSLSSDMRVLDTIRMDPSSVDASNTYGRVAAVVAVLVGFSFNFMSAIHMNGRLLLVNGTHRAYALRAHGLTHAPCLVIYVRSPEELELTAPVGNETRPADWHFSYPRPPLLRDFFDERVTRTVIGRENIHLLQMDVQFSEGRVPLM